ncbi:MAG: hypothetical protein ACK5Q5_23525 [Planctomycetaceae bacterium]
MLLRSPATTLAILVSTFATQSLRADAVIIDDHQNSGIQLVSHDEFVAPQRTDIPASDYGALPPHPAAALPAPHAGPNVYPRLNAPMYPSPVQNTPAWNGGTFITNQAFAPHEMTYPHKYHAMYPPFYHKVKGKWMLTPFGVRQHEEWKLEGTEVMVNYRSRFRLFSGYHPPR